MGYIVTINSDSSIATNLISYLKTFDFVTVTKEKTKPQTKGLSAALALSKTRKATKISQQEIVDECGEVRKKIYEK